MIGEFTLNAHNLSRLIDAVKPHIDVDSYHPILDGVLFESDGTHLHAIATDRYTVGVARAKQPIEGPSWRRLLAGPHVNALRTWLDTSDGQEIVTLTLDDAGVTFTSLAGTLRTPTTDGGQFPDWRKLLRDHANSAAEAPLTVLSTDFLQRWNAADRYVQVWQASPTKPFVVAAEDFLGMQMPMAKASYPDTPIETLSAWAGSLGIATDSEPTTPAEDVLNGHTSLGRTDDLAESLLKQVLHSSADLDQAIVGDPRAAAAHALAGIHAWTAYRLLDILRKADPLLAATTVKNLDEELEHGEFSEHAWDEAQAAGHDPQKWAEDYEAARENTKAPADSTP